MAAYSQDPKIRMNCPKCGASLRYAATTSMSGRPVQSSLLCPTGTEMHYYVCSRAVCGRSWRIGLDTFGEVESALVPEPAPRVH